MTSAPATDTYAVDGIVPDSVVTAGSLDELSSALKAAHTSREAVVPWGGGTRMHIGNVPERYTVALDLSNLSSNVEHEAGDLTVVADAGVKIADLSETLGKQGQRLPFDVRHPERATLGGSVASNAGGHARSSMGGIRDWIIGIKVVLADGTVTKSGGRVVKNVQGFDLHRLHTGAFGTLGVIAEVALKVVPIPASSSTIAAWFGSVEEAGEFAMQVFDGPAMPEAFTVFAGGAALSRFPCMDTPVDPGSANSLVLATVSGGEKSVARQENDLTGLAGSIGAQGYEVLRGAAADSIWGQPGGDATAEQLTLRGTFKPDDAVKLLAKSVSASEQTQVSGELQAGFGTLTLTLAAGTHGDIERLRGLASEHGGQLVVERCPTEMKSQIDVFGDQGTALSVMRSIKQQFDPKRVLNPGRFAGRI